MTEMRKDRRAPASLKVKYKSATVDDFIEQFGTDVSRGGIFIKTKKPLEAGALLKFEFQLQDGSAVLHGVGRVAWRRLEQQARPDLPAGMGIKFFKLSDHSRVVVERIESRYTGNKSRYELTDAAEFAPPLSGAPAADSGASPLPGNGRRPLGAGSGPLTMPPPPALSSIPPALADVPARPGPPPPPRVPGRTASGNVLPKGTMGSFFPETQPRISGSPQNRSRDTSEFLASAFQAGGAGPEVRAAARAQAERARRDPESIDLGRELFGDLGDVASPPPPLLQQPRQPSGPARTPSGPARSPSGSGALSFGDVTPHETPTHRPPPSDEAQDAFNLITPIPAATLPRGAGSGRPSLGERIPSIEQLVDEASVADLQASNVGSQRAGRASGGAHAAAGLRTPQPSAASAAPAEERTEGHPPLTLAISVPTATPSVQPGESRGRSRLLLFVALASTIVLGGVAVYIAMQRSGAPAPVESPAEVATAPAPTPAAAPQPAAQPEQPAAAAAEPTPAPAAEPAPPAGPEVPVVIQSKPRGAEVWIGDKSQGMAPVTLKLPSGAPIEVSVRSAGYASVTRAITPAEKAAPESFELAPLPFQLVIHTEPEGAVIATTKNRVVSPAPLDLGHLESIINVSIEKEGFQKTTRAMRVDEFREESGVMRAELSLSLTPLPAAAARRRPVRAATPTAAPSDAPPEPNEGAPSAPPVMQVKPEGESHTAEPAPAEPPPEAKAKPLEPAQEKPATPPPAEPAPAAPAN